MQMMLGRTGYRTIVVMTRPQRHSHNIRKLKCFTGTPQRRTIGAGPQIPPSGCSGPDFARAPLTRMRVTRGAPSPQVQAPSLPGVISRVLRKMPFSYKTRERKTGKLERCGLIPGPGGVSDRLFLAGTLIRTVHSARLHLGASCPTEPYNVEKSFYFIILHKYCPTVCYRRRQPVISQLLQYSRDKSQSISRLLRYSRDIDGRTWKIVTRDSCCRRRRTVSLRGLYSPLLR